MTGKETLEKREQLENELKEYLARMILTSEIINIQKEIQQLQEECPHYDATLNLTIADPEHCPYCGGKIE